MSSGWVRAAGAALWVVCVGAVAGTLPPPRGTVWYTGSDGRGHADRFGSASETHVLTGDGGAQSPVLPLSSAITLTAAPAISFEVRPVCDTCYGDLAAGASLNYFFDVNGTPGAVVPVHFTGWLSVTAAQLNQFHGFVSVSTASFNSAGQFQGDGTGIELASGGTSSQSQPALPGTLDLDVLQADRQTGVVKYYTARGVGHSLFTGTVLATLDASGHAQGQVGLNGQVYASANSANLGLMGPVSMYIDPQLQIDATWLAAHPSGASLTLPDGVGNAAPVPEPASWVLLAGGLGLLAARRHRRARR